MFSLMSMILYGYRNDRNSVSNWMGRNRMKTRKLHFFCSISRTFSLPWILISLVFLFCFIAVACFMLIPIDQTNPTERVLTLLTSLTEIQKHWVSYENGFDWKNFHILFTIWSQPPFFSICDWQLGHGFVFLLKYWSVPWSPFRYHFLIKSQVSGSWASSPQPKHDSKPHVQVQPNRYANTPLILIAFEQPRDGHQRNDFLCYEIIQKPMKMKTLKCQFLAKSILKTELPGQSY